MQRFRRNLRRWYDKHARELPWRATNDAYRIWISEIMLQQTTVSAVIPYFERFLGRFPGIEQLAAADEEDVLRCWEGLGYYSRARNIHRTARSIVEENAGLFPSEVDSLMKLPGIGRYTAGAIASFAYDERAPIVEANTLRLYSRLMGYRGDPRSLLGQKTLWEFAERILPRKQPGRFNQALMELGGTVCTPIEPGCCRCPVRSSCQALALGSQGEIPLPPTRPQITEVIEASVAIRKGNKYLLRRREPGERWAGLWDFPRYAVDEKHAPKPSTKKKSRPASSVSAVLKRRLQMEVEQTTGIDVEIGDLLTEIKHSVTRYRIRLLCLLGWHRAGSLNGDEQLRWVGAADFDDLPFSVTGRKLAKLLANLDLQTESSSFFSVNSS